MANKIVKSRRALLILGIISLVFFAGAIAGAIILLLGCQKPGLSATDFGLQLGWGIVLAVLCAFFFFWGVFAVWTSTAIKATDGSIADPAIVKGTVNGKKCPKCGCTNTPDSTKCQNCGEPLE